MKRWFSIALILALLAAPVSQTLPTARADEITGADIRTEAVESAPGEDAGLVVEFGEWTPVDEAPAEPGEGDEAEPAQEEEAAPEAAAVYARVRADAPIYPDAADETPAAVLAGGGVVLLLEQGEARARVAFFAETGVTEAWMDRAALDLLGGDETARYLDEAAAATAVALYGDDLNRPLTPVACAFPEAEEAPAAESTEEPTTEPTEEPTAEPTEEPTAEPTEEPTAEPTEEPTAELAEEPTAELAEEPTVEPTAGETDPGLGTVLVSGTPAPTAAPTPMPTPEPTPSPTAVPTATPVPTPTPVPTATGLQLAETSVTLGVGETIGAVGVSPLPAGSVLANLTWTSDNASIARVDRATGAITGVKTGATYINANLPGASARCKVTVKKAPTAVTLTPAALELSAGGMTAQLSASVSGYAGTLTYRSNRTAIASVDENGLVTAKKAGAAVITVSTYNGVSAECRVRVAAAPAAIAFTGITGTSATIAAGQKLSLKAEARAANGSAVPAAIAFAIDPNGTTAGCVRLDAGTGKVTGVKKGRATIVATAHNGVSARCEISVLPAPAGIRLSATSLAIGVGETYAGIAATFTPPAGETQCLTTLTWSSSKKSVAKVDKNTGAITGVKTGTAVITAKTHNGKTAKCTVSVKKAPASVTLNRDVIALSAGGMSAKLTANLGGGASGKLTWKSSKPAVASVDRNGRVTTGKKTGTAVVSVTTFNGKAAKCTVKVSAKPASIVFTGAQSASATIAAGQKLYLKAEARTAAGRVTPATITYAVAANSANPDCVSLNAKTGRVTGVKKGMAVIVATAHNGVSARCTVRVKPAPTAIALSASTAAIGKGETYTGVSAVLTPPAGETDCLAVVTWISSKKSVATVDRQTGVITGVKVGTATITARTHNGLKAACKVTVKKAPSSIAVSPKKLTLSADGMTARLTPVMPGGCASGRIKYKSSKPAVASVDASGLVTSGGKTGSAVITVTAFNGVKARCTVKVIAAPVSVAFAAAPEGTAKIGVGQVFALDAEARTAAGRITPATIAYAVAADSANPDCVSVDPETGAVTALKKGSVAIVATAHNGVSARCKISVLAAPAAISLGAQEIAIGKGEKYAELTASLTPPAGENRCAAGITWASANKAIAKVHSGTGLVTGVKTGTTTITARTHNGLQAQCRVTVMKAPGSVTLSPDHLSLSAGGMTAQLAAALPDGCASGVVTFESSAEAVASVSPGGLVTGLSAGSATITVTTFNGKKDTCAVTVAPEPQSVVFPDREGEKLIVATEGTLKLRAEARAANGAATPANIVYAVSALSPNRDCIAVDSATGEVTGLKKGRAYVVAKAHNGVYARRMVHVGAEPESLVIEAPSVVLGKGESHDALAVTLVPPAGESVAATVLTWSSSDANIVSIDAQTGRFTAKQTGSAVIMATSRNNKMARCPITVLKPPHDLSISPQSGSLVVGATGQYTVSMPEDCTGGVTFSSSNTVVATVDEFGLATALKAGTTIITATAYNGATAQARLTVSGYGDPPPTDQYESLTPTVTEFDPDLSNHDKLEYMIYLAMQQLGKPYVYGGGYGSSASGFDCSGLAYYCFKRIGVTLKGTAYLQGYDNSQPIVNYMTELRRGDLVFFNTNESDDDLSDHTGIYIGNGYFIHASSSANKVVISQFVSSTSNYYVRAFSWGRRVLPQDGF